MNNRLDMREITKEVIDFLEDHLRHYNNVHDVTMLLFDDNSMCVSTTWWVDPSNANEDVDILLECSFDEFISLFGITSIDQLHSINHHLLLQKYKEGLAEVSCVLDGPEDYYQLIFLVKGQHIWATDNFNKSHKVYTWLEAPAEFLKYTKQYFGC